MKLGFHKYFYSKSSIKIRNIGISFKEKFSDKASRKLESLSAKQVIDQCFNQLWIFNEPFTLFL